MSRYNAEIKSVTGKDAAKETGIASQLQRHFAGLKSLTVYRSAFTAMVEHDDWMILDTFFEHSIECSQPISVLRAAICDIPTQGSGARSLRRIIFMVCIISSNGLKTLLLAEETRSITSGRSSVLKSRTCGDLPRLQI